MTINRQIKSLNDYDLASHSLMLCALILYIIGGTYNLKSTTNYRFLPQIWYKEVVAEIYSYFSFLCLTCCELTTALNWLSLIVEKTKNHFFENRYIVVEYHVVVLDEP